MTEPILHVEDLDDNLMQRLRRTNLGRLLDEVHMGFDRMALAYLHEAGYPLMTSAHTHVLRTMRMEGASVTQMAEQAGISKQAMSKLVAFFEKEGFLERRPVEGGVAQLVHATEKGRILLVVGLKALNRAENDYFGALSEMERETLRSLLLRAAVSAGAPANPLTHWRRRRA